MKGVCFRVCFAAVLVVLFQSQGQLLAQDPDSLGVMSTLDTVRIMEYSGKANQDAPCSYQTIRREEYNLIHIGQEPSILLSQLSPSVTFYTDAGSGLGYSYFRMRGMDQTRINMTLNGVPLNEPEDQGVYFSNYPDVFKSISEFQLQRGIGLSQNGTASYAGSLQMEGPRFNDSTHTEFGMGYGSFNTFRAYAEHKSKFEKGGFYVRGSHLQSDGYKYHSGNQSQSLYLAGQRYWGGHRFRFTSVSGRQANQMAWLGVSDSLISIDRRTNANAEQEDDRFIQSLNMLQHEFDPNKHVRLFTTAYYNFLDGNYDFDLNNYLGLPSTQELYNYAFRSHFYGAFSQVKVNWEDLRLDAGIHFNRYERQHTGSESSLGQLYQNKGIKREGSVFVKASYSFGKLMAFVDLQERAVEFDYVQGDRTNLISLQFFSPRAALRFEMPRNGFLYYSAGRVGREPTRTDLFGGNDDPLRDSTGQLVLFITQPEYVVDQELGWHFRFNRGEGTVNLFWMSFQNEITLNGKFGPNGLALNSDFAKSYRSGIEWTFRYMPIKGLRLTQTGNLNRSRIQDQGVEFQPIYTPWIIVNQGVEYQVKRWRVGTDLRYQGTSYIDFANTTQLDDYFLLNAQAAYELPKWTFKVLANNLLGTRYFNQGYIDWDGSAKYFVQASFNAHAAVSFRF